MTIRLPNGLDDLNWLVGTDFPEADEDALWRLAESWSRASRELFRLAGEGDRLGVDVVAALDGEAGRAFLELWRRIARAPTGFVEQLAEACGQMAVACDDAAREVEYAKLQYIVALIVLAAAIAWLLATAFLGGVSTAGIPIAVAAAQITIRIVLVRLVSAVALGATFNVAIDAIAQGIQLLEGHRGAWDWAKTARAAGDGAAYGAIGGAVFLGAGRLIPGAVGSPAGLLATAGAAGGVGGVAVPLLHGEAPTGKDVLIALVSGAVGGVGPDLRPGHGRMSTVDFDGAAAVESGLRDLNGNHSVTNLLAVADAGWAADRPAPDGAPGRDGAVTASGRGTDAVDDGALAGGAVTDRAPGLALPAHGVSLFEPNGRAAPTSPDHGQLAPPDRAGASPGASGAGSAVIAGLAEPVRIAPPGTPASGAPLGSAPSSPPGATAPVGSTGVTLAGPGAAGSTTPSPWIAAGPHAAATPPHGPPPAHAGSGEGGVRDTPLSDPTSAAELDPHLTDGQAIDLVRRTVFVTDAGLAFYPIGDELRPFAEAVHPTEGFVTLDLHGSPDGFHIDDRKLTPQQLGLALRDLMHQGVLELPAGAGIKLVSCDTAHGGESSAAAQLARDLGVTVIAPDKPIWTAADGTEIVASPVPFAGFLVPKYPPDGHWHRFDGAHSGIEVALDGVDPDHDGGAGHSSLDVRAHPAEHGWPGGGSVVARGLGGPLDLADGGRIDPEHFVGRDPAEIVEAIPPHWHQRPSQSGDGVVFVDPNRSGHQIRIMPGYPSGSRPDSLTHAPYAVISAHGQKWKVPLMGNPAGIARALGGEQ